MAGAGFKTFNTGDVLTASDVNTYLMQQTVMVFASSAARSTALGANVAEGMLSYLKDTDKVEVYNGSAWVASDDPDAIQNSIVDAKGDLISATAADTPARLASSGVNGDVLTVDTSTATGLKWSAPASGGFTWKDRLNGSNSGGSNIVTIAYNGSNLYAVGGSSGFLATSPDLVTWTTRTSGFGSSAINKIIFANNLWVAVGNSGLISTSSDGITWTARTANFGTNTIRDITFAASNFVAVGNGGGATNTGGITYSTDGITWTRKSQTPTIGSEYYCITYNGTNFVVGALLSTNNILYASTPGGTWTAAKVFGDNVNGIWYDGTRTIYAVSSNGFYYSTSTTLATQTLYDYPLPVSTAAPETMRQITYYNGKIYQYSIQYIQAFGTAPSSVRSTQPGAMDPVQINPIVYLDATTAQWSNQGTCILVTANGIIVGGQYGRIYSSF